MALLNPAFYGATLSGTLTAATAVVSVNNIRPVSTIVFNSATSPTIQLSLDNGASYYPAVTPTGTKTGQLYYVLNFPVTHIKFTGATNDTWLIL